MLAPLNRVIIFVGDVQKCAAFYREIFDFKIVGDPAAKDWLELDTGGCRLAFHQAHGPNGVIDGPTGSPMHPHKIVFHSDDVAATRRHWLKRGAKDGRWSNLRQPGHVRRPRSRGTRVSDHAIGSNRVNTGGLADPICFPRSSYN
jgi:catechol 2,3-dioxygenase-like lactoylglutathione lyase family enzyme